MACFSTQCSQIHRLRNEAATVGSSRDNQGKFMARLQLLKPKRSPRTDQEEQPSVSLTERGVYRRRASILVDSSIRCVHPHSAGNNPCLFACRNLQICFLSPIVRACVIRLYVCLYSHVRRMYRWIPI